MCHINILYVYVFNITSSLINIHVVQRVGGCRAISTSPRPGGTAAQRGWARVRPGAAATSPASPSAPIPPPRALCRALGTTRVSPGPGDSPRRAAGAQCCSNTQTKRTSCQFVDPSPSSFNFLASAYRCCVRAPSVKCENAGAGAGWAPCPGGLSLRVRIGLPATRFEAIIARLGRLPSLCPRPRAAERHLRLGIIAQLCTVCHTLLLNFIPVMKITSRGGGGENSCPGRAAPEE